MEIEVGEYVKLERGEIFKIDEYTTNYYNSNKEYITNEVVKHSKNIIDLIEVNDIVVTKHPALKKIYYEHIWSEEYLKHTKDYLNEKSLILLQILTHEQFKQNAYRLEE